MLLLPSQMTRAQFVAAFADVFEESPWVAEGAWDAGIAAQHDSPDALAEAMAAVVERAGGDAQLALIMAHPVLGTKKKMGAYSTDEQRQANIAGMDAADERRLRALNDAYMKKFSMPFIMAVRGAAVPDIIAALEQRLQTADAAVERGRALEQIYKIARLRLQALWE